MSNKFPNNFVFVNHTDGSYKIISQNPKFRKLVEEVGFNEWAMDFICTAYYTEKYKKIKRLEDSIKKSQEELAIMESELLESKSITIPEFQAENY